MSRKGVCCRAKQSHTQGNTYCDGDQSKRQRFVPPKHGFVAVAQNEPRERERERATINTCMRGGSSRTARAYLRIHTHSVWHTIVLLLAVIVARFVKHFSIEWSSLILAWIFLTLKILSFIFYASIFLIILLPICVLSCDLMTPSLTHMHKAVPQVRSLVELLLLRSTVVIRRYWRDFNILERSSWMNRIGARNLYTSSPIDGAVKNHQIGSCQIVHALGWNQSF